MRLINKMCEKHFPEIFNGNVPGVFGFVGFELLFDQVLFVGGIEKV